MSIIFREKVEKETTLANVNGSVTRVIIHAGIDHL